MFNYIITSIVFFISLYIIKKVIYILSLNLIFKNFKHDFVLNLDEIKNDIKRHFNKDVELSKYFVRSETTFIDTLLIRPIKNNLNYPEKLIIYFHGNAGNINSVVHSGELKKLLSFNCSILIFDYRGFGRSTGNSDEDSIIYDSQVIYEFCLNYLSFDSKNIMFFSNSLGCYIGLSTINQLINLNIDLPKCIILQNPFYSVFDIAYELYGKIAFLLPIKMNNNKNIKKILNNHSNYKIFVLHSTYDEFIKITHSEKLCKNNNLDLIKIKGSHNCPILDDEITDKIKDYFI